MRKSKQKNYLREKKDKSQPRNHVAALKNKEIQKNIMN